MELGLRRSTRVRGAALVFHAVAPHAGDPATELDPPVQANRLDSAVRYLMRRYTLVHAAELPSAARARKSGGPVPVAVTFDDDLPSHRDQALPTLSRHGAAATVFLCGARAPFWWQLLQSAIDARAIAPDELPPLDPSLIAPAIGRVPGAIGRLAKAVEDLEPAERDRVTRRLHEAAPADRRLLTPEDAAALAAAGWEIGFHTRRHDVLTALGDDALREALVQGRDTLPGPPRTLAYPHGKATGREARAARDAGYLAAYTGRAEVLTGGTDTHLIGRLQPDMSTLGRFALGLARALAAS